MSSANKPTYTPEEIQQIIKTGDRDDLIALQEIMQEECFKYHSVAYAIDMNRIRIRLEPTR